VIVYFTNCIDPALVIIHAGVLTLLTNTCKGSGTVGVHRAFWLALDIRVTLQTWGTAADTSVSGWSGYGIQPTGIWITRIGHCRLRWWWPPTLNESIAYVPGQARAKWRVISDITLCIAATDPNTRIITGNSCKPCLRGSRCLRHTLAYTLCTDPRINLEDKSKRTRHPLAWPMHHGRKGWGCTGR